MSDIIELNLQLMRSHQPGGMLRLAMEESMGGNAGTWNKYSCVATNFYYEPETGLIVVFGNSQSVPTVLKEGRAHGMFRIALDLHPPEGGHGTRIVEAFVEQDHPLARDVIHRCVEEYNEKSGFRALSRVDEGFTFKAVEWPDEK